VVYDDLFETVHASPSEAPASWPDLFVFNRFHSNYDDEDFIPSLADEWLTPIELTHRQQQDQIQRSQDVAPDDTELAPEALDDDVQPQRAPPEPALPTEPPPEPSALQRAPPSSPESPQRAPPEALPPESPSLDNTPPTPV
jgi:hypothetical protein